MNVIQEKKAYEIIVVLSTLKQNIQHFSLSVDHNFITHMGP